MYFLRALEDSIRGECMKLGMGGGSVGSPGESMGLPYITPKGLSSRGFPGKALYFEENNRQKFSPIQMYLEG